METRLRDVAFGHQQALTDLTSQGRSGVGGNTQQKGLKGGKVLQQRGLRLHLSGRHCELYALSCSSSDWLHLVPAGLSLNVTFQRGLPGHRTKGDLLQYPLSAPL